MNQSPRNRFRDAVLADRPAISAELTLSRESTRTDVERQVEALGPWVDAFQLTDNPYAWVQMSALTAASIVAEAGHEPVPILTCRDRNRHALCSDLKGLHAMGVQSLMLMRGHRVPENHSVPARTVFDLTGRELISMASEQGDFFIGTGARVFRPNRGWQADSLKSRLEKGARFIQTQICFNLPMLRGYLQRLSAAGLSERCSVMVTLAPLPSLKTAEWIKKTLGDSRIPSPLLERLAQAEDEAAAGLEAAVETLRELAEIPGVAGIHFMTTGDPDAIVQIIRASGLRD